MIKNERDYLTTRQQVDKFTRTIQDLENQQHQQDSEAANGNGSESAISPRLRQAEIDGLRSLLEELEVDLNEYQQLKSGQMTHFRLTSLSALPETLIKARIARGWTQKQLAESLGLREQQIQRYEATDYESISLHRLIEIAELLELQDAPDSLDETVPIADRAPQEADPDGSEVAEPNQPTSFQWVPPAKWNSMGKLPTSLTALDKVWNRESSLGETLITDESLHLLSAKFLSKGFTESSKELRTAIEACRRLFFASPRTQSVPQVRIQLRRQQEQFDAFSKIFDKSIGETNAQILFLLVTTDRLAHQLYRLTGEGTEAVEAEEEINFRFPTSKQR